MTEQSNFVYVTTLSTSAALVCFGLLVILVSGGFLMNLLGACIAGFGGAAAYLILSHGNDKDDW